MRDAFEYAWRRHPTLEAGYLVAGHPARLRVAGTALARFVGAAFAHLRDPRAEGASPLAVDLWDADETGVPGPELATAPTAGRSWALEDGMLTASGDGAIVSHASQTSVLWLDREECRIAGWMSDAREMPLYERARPLQIPLALYASDRGVHAVHGGFVARDGRGVLLAGDSGAGKSTAALCCLEAGWTYLGDDWVGIERNRDGVFTAHSLYGSVSLEPEQVACFPRLRTQAVPPRVETDLKSLIDLADVFPARLGRMAAVRALALPRLTGAVQTRVRPASKRDALLTMARSALCSQRPRSGREAMTLLTRLAQEVPAFWLDLGRDLAHIPPRIDELLAAALP